MPTKLPLLGQITNFLCSMLFTKLPFTFIGFTISTFLNKGKLSFLLFGWFYFLYILKLLFYSRYCCADGTESRLPWDGRTVKTPIPGFLHVLFSMKVKLVYSWYFDVLVFHVTDLTFCCCWLYVCWNNLI